MAAIIVGGILLVVGVVLILVARSRGKLKAQMDAMETVPVAELREATHAELKGVAACETPITPPECELVPGPGPGDGTGYACRVPAGLAPPTMYQRYRPRLHPRT